MNRLLPQSGCRPPPPPLLAATLTQGIDLVLCVAVPVFRSTPHLFGEEKGGSVVSNRGGIHGQAWGQGRLPGTDPAWRSSSRERKGLRPGLGSCLCPRGRVCILCEGRCRKGEVGVLPS